MYVYLGANDYLWFQVLEVVWLTGVKEETCKVLVKYIDYDNPRVHFVDGRWVRRWFDTPHARSVIIRSSDS
jgi:hypothetical protein